MSKKIKVKTSEGIIERVAKPEKFGNFVMLKIRYDNREYYVGEGTEYLRGLPEVFELKPTKVIKTDYNCGGKVYKAKNKIDALNMYLENKDIIKSWNNYDIDVFPGSDKEEEKVKEIFKEHELNIKILEL